MYFFFFFSSRRRHTRSLRDWSSDVCSSDLAGHGELVDDSWTDAPDELAVPGLDRPVLLRRRNYHDILRRVLDEAGRGFAEIGRASCREKWRCRWSADH